MTASSQAGRGGGKEIFLGSLIIVLLVAAAYFPSMRGEFLWDDPLMLSANPCVTGHDGLKWIWFSNKSSDYLPLVFSSFWLEWRLWGANPMGYHLVNVALHVLGAILLWQVLLQLKIRHAWLIATLFAVHPVNVASVAWISERKNVLSFVFYLTSLILYLRYDSPPLAKKPAPPARKWYWLSFAAFALALLSKASVVILPMVLLGCIWWRNSRLTRRDIIRVIPFFALSLILGLVAVWFQSNRAMGGDMTQTDSLFIRLLGGSWAVWFYLWKTILPVHLSMIYPRWEIDVTSLVAYLPGLALATLLFLSWFYRRGWGRPCLFGLGYFIVALLPVLGFFSMYFFVYSRAADHWAYLALPGVLALLLNAVARLANGWARWAFGAIVTMLICSSTFLSHERAKVFASTEALWRDTITNNPGSWIAYNDLGKAISDRGGDPVPYYIEAIRLNPDYAIALNNLGSTLYTRGQYDEAVANFRKAIRLAPDSADFHSNLGCALLVKGDLDQCIREFTEALRFNPTSVSAHNNIAVAFTNKGLLEKAKAHYVEALRLKPDYADAHFSLAKLLFAEGKVVEAIGHYSAVLQINPNYPNAREQLIEAQNRLKGIQP